MKIHLRNTTQELTETYQNLADMTSLVYGDSFYGDIENTTDPHNQEYILSLLAIENLVGAIIRTTETPYQAKTDNQGKQFILEFKPLTKFFHDVTELFELYSDDYRYSPHVSLFFESCYELDLGKEHLFKPYQYSGRQVLQYVLFNELVALIRTKAKSAVFRARLFNHEQKAIKRLESCEQVVREVFEKCSRVDVLRIDLSIQYQYLKDVTLEDVQSYFKRFLNNRRHKPNLFSRQIGYIWKLEWAPRKGYHYHVVFFYKRLKFNQDGHWAKTLIEYWEKITQGKGQGFNCNWHKDRYHRLGIGRIDRRDPKKQAILLNDVLAYLCKTDQYLRVNHLNQVRCFDSGCPPKSSNAGRKRGD